MEEKLPEKQEQKMKVSMDIKSFPRLGAIVFALLLALIAAVYAKNAIISAGEALGTISVCALMLVWGFEPRD